MSGTELAYAATGGRAPKKKHAPGTPSPLYSYADPATLLRSVLLCSYAILRMLLRHLLLRPYTISRYAPTPRAVILLRNIPLGSYTTSPPASYARATPCPVLSKGMLVLQATETLGELQRKVTAEQKRSEVDPPPCYELPPYARAMRCAVLT
eukprot:58341-Rhodomonas_salina.1